MGVLDSSRRWEVADSHKYIKLPRLQSGKKTTTQLLPHTADTLPPNMLVMKPGGAIVFEMLALKENHT